MYLGGYRLVLICSVTPPPPQTLLNPCTPLSPSAPRMLHSLEVSTQSISSTSFMIAANSSVVGPTRKLIPSLSLNLRIECPMALNSGATMHTKYIHDETCFSDRLRAEKHNAPIQDFLVGYFLQNVLFYNKNVKNSSIRREVIIIDLVK